MPFYLILWIVALIIANFVTHRQDDERDATVERARQHCEFMQGDPRGSGIKQACDDLMNENQ